MKKLLFLSVLALAACNMSQKPKEEEAATSTGHHLIQKWETDSLLKTPESVLFDKANNVLYVSNIDGKEPWGVDGKGSIAKVGLDGKIIAAEWVKGFDAPKGIGMYDGKLYVADITNLVVVDIKAGKIDKKIPIAGSTGLNDVSVDAKGVVYVTDSQGKKVFRVENGKPELLLENLKGPNGILSHNGTLYVLDNGGMYQINDDKSLSKITDGMDGNTDGIENIGGSDFIISCWEGALWYVNAADSTKHLMMDTRKEKRNTADLGIDPATKTIYVPTFWKNTVVAYEVK
jgi:sugar lactone lactonase YvrE